MRSNKYTRSGTIKARVESQFSQYFSSLNEMLCCIYRITDEITCRKALRKLSFIFLCIYFFAVLFTPIACRAYLWLCAQSSQGTYPASVLSPGPPSCCFYSIEAMIVLLEMFDDKSFGRSDDIVKRFHFKLQLVSNFMWLVMLVEEPFLFI